MIVESLDRAAKRTLRDVAKAYDLHAALIGGGLVAVWTGRNKRVGILDSPHQQELDKLTIRVTSRLNRLGRRRGK